MMRWLRWWLLALAVAGGRLSAATGVVWSKPAQEFQASSEEECKVVTFSFTNRGSKPVRVAKVESDCSCTEARPQRGAVAPGETGEVVLEFSFGERTGRQEREIKVTFEDAPAVVHRLTFAVTIDEIVVAAPRRLIWEPGTDVVEQRVKLTLLKPGITRLGTPQVNPGVLSAELIPGDTPNVMWLRLKPLTRVKPEVAVVLIPTRVGEKERFTKVFAALQ
ncbi:MAG: DUF1573 domain-containing protein [Opitutaceae bacterium]|nr:DUF1573 domain-containing protein [Opitutaceae bacterium]